MLMQNVVAVRCGIGKSFLMGSMSSMHTGQRAQPLNSKDGVKFREEDAQIGQSRCIAVKVEMKHYMYKGSFAPWSPMLKNYHRHCLVIE